MSERSNHAAVDRADLRADDPHNGTPVLTVIVPVYNEAGTIFELLARVVAVPYSKQIIVVDDGSTDGTAEALRTWQDDAQFKLLRHDVNRGTGAAIRTALVHARGRFTIIQDADLEYDPEDYPRLLGPLLEGKARAVFGSRFMSETPHDPLWRKAVRWHRAMKSHVQDAMKSLARHVTTAGKAVWRLITLDWKSLAVPARESDVHPTKVAGSPAPPTKRRSQLWGPRRLGAAVLKHTARLLYRARLSDVATCFKAFSTELLRKLDLQCERFEFGPEVAAKLCRAGEKIVEVPIRFERRVARSSWRIERFARRAIESADSGPRQMAAGKKHRCTDGPRALATLWRWRHWAPQTPDPDRIPAIAPATNAHTRKSTVGEAVPVAIAPEIDHWAEEDAKRSNFDEAVWNDPARPHPADSSAESLVAEVLAANPEVREGKSFVAAAFAAAAATFEPRLMWERFVRKPTSPAPAPEPDEDDLGEDWQKWSLTDLFLLLAIVNIGLVLFVTCVPAASTWPGYLLAGLASVVAMRITRAGRISLDKYNQALGILTILLVCLMLPSSWVWRDRALMLTAAAPLIAGLRRIRKWGNSKPERNLLHLFGTLAFLFAGFRAISPPLRIVELLVLLLITTAFVMVQWKRMRGRLSDNVLLYLTVIGIFLVVVFASGFPINVWSIPWNTQWLTFRYAVLAHWTEIWWLRWGIVAVLAGMVGSLLYWRKRWGFN
jgi:hypothetical protein